MQILHYIMTSLRIIKIIAAISAVPSRQQRRSKQGGNRAAYPPVDNKSELANEMKTFLVQKIETIGPKLHNMAKNIAQGLQSLSDHHIPVSNPLSEKEVRKRISSSVKGHVWALFYTLPTHPSYLRWLKICLHTRTAMRATQIYSFLRSLHYSKNYTNYHCKRAYISRFCS